MSGLMPVVKACLQQGGLDDAHLEANLVAGFLENSLPEKLREQVWGHLLVCPDCRQMLFLAAPAPDLSADARQFRVSDGSARLWWRWRWALAGSMLLIVSSIGVLLRVGGPTTVLNPKSQGIVATESVVRPSPKIESTSKAVAHAPATKSHRGANVVMKDQREISSPSAPYEMVQTRTLVHSSNGDVTGSMAAVPYVSRAMPAVTWQLAGSGELYRCAADGMKCEAASIGREIVFRDLASVGESIWVVSRRGTVFWSSDSGVKWNEVSPPLLKHDAVVRISMQDAMNVMATTKSGQRWTTRDGGKVWRQLGAIE